MPNEQWFHRLDLATRRPGDSQAVALAFGLTSHETWAALVKESGLSQPAAVDVLVEPVTGSGEARKEMPGNMAALKQRVEAG